MKNYLYTVGWFQTVAPNMEKHLSKFKGLPVTGLEIGCFEGMSTVWLMENIMTNPDSRLIVIDTFKGNPELKDFDMAQIQRRFEHNIKETGAGDRVTEHVGDSKDIVPTLGQLDFAYVDGSHESRDVFRDGNNAFKLLKRGGVLIFDDYGWTEDVAPIHKPVTGINIFLEEHRWKCKVLEINYQVAVEKL